MIPAPNDACWRRALTGEADLGNVSLSTRLLVSRLRREISADPGALSAAIDELRGFFSENASAQADIARL